MKKSLITLLHLAFWFCTLFIIVVVTGIYYRNHSYPEEIKQGLNTIIWVVVVPSLLSFYTFYFLIFPRYLNKRKFVLSTLFGLLVVFIIASIGMMGVSVNVKNAETKLVHLPFFMFITILSGVAGLLIKGFVAWFSELRFKETLVQKNHEMEMALVKAQLDPHFLFNTINNIDVLILKNHEQASEYLNKLSDILRFMLYEAKTDKIPLKREIEYINKYIELQKIRTSNLNYVNFRVSGNVNDKSIAPMIFTPFIENAFKHTTNKKADNAIYIHLIIKDKQIDFLCENKYNPLLRNKGVNNGLGNELIQKRLDLIYPGHKLVIDKKEQFYSVQLTLYHG